MEAKRHQIRLNNGGHRIGNQKISLRYCPDLVQVWADLDCGYECYYVSVVLPYFLLNLPYHAENLQFLGCLLGLCSLRSAKKSVPKFKSSLCVCLQARPYSAFCCNMSVSFFIFRQNKKVVNVLALLKFRVFTSSRNPRKKSDFYLFIGI